MSQYASDKMKKGQDTCQDKFLQRNMLQLHNFITDDILPRIVLC